jgi:hypothetical protein
MKNHRNQFGKNFKIYRRLIVTAAVFSLLLQAIAPVSWLPGAGLVQAVGSGTESDPIQIDTIQELQNIANGLDKHYVLTKDIELDAASNWKPMGTAAKPFIGSLDGQGHKIKNLRIVNPTSNLGLFAYISNAKIKNMILENVNIQGLTYISALVSSAAGVNEIVNCSVSGFLKGTQNVGSLVGYCNGTATITNCSVNSRIEAVTNSGGLLGYSAGKCNIVKSTMSGAITASDRYIGGLVGALGGGTIQQSHNTANITSTNIGIGGIVGYSYRGLNTIKDCSNSGIIRSGGYSGGIIGYQPSTGGSEILTSFNSGAIISSGDYIGGLAGDTYSTCQIKESANFGKVQGRTYVGGVVGFVYAGSSMQNTYNRGNIIGTGSIVGGLIGFFNTSGKIQFCYSSGDVTATQYVGGLVGQAYQGSLLNSFAMNESVTATTDTGSRITGNIRGSLTENNNMAFEDMIVTVNGVIRSIKDSNPTHTSLDGMNGTKLSVTNNSAFLESLNWDFRNIWKSLENKKDYPILRNLNLTPPELGVWVDGVSLDTNTKTIKVGETTALTATISPANATNQELIWNSNHSEIATVSSDGQVTAQAAGFVTITVRTVDGDFTTSCDFTVVASSGTEDDPILINTVQGLKAISNGLDKHYILTQNIDLAEIVNWQPLGRSTAPFTGSLDGNGYQILNLSIVAPAYYAALFAYATNAKIKNLTLEAVNIQGTSHIAALIAVSAGSTTISNCSVTGQVLGSGSCVGGLVSYMSGRTIIDCQMAGTVTGVNYIGGLVGRLSNGEIRHSQSTAKVSASGQNYGEMAGMADKNAIIIE